MEEASYTSEAARGAAEVLDTLPDPLVRVGATWVATADERAEALAPLMRERSV